MGIDSPQFLGKACDGKTRRMQGTKGPAGMPAGPLIRFSAPSIFYPRLFNV